MDAENLFIHTPIQLSCFDTKVSSSHGFITGRNLAAARNLGTGRVVDRPCISQFSSLKVTSYLSK